MASTPKLFITLTLLLVVQSLASSTAVAARSSLPRSHHGEMLAARLKVDGDSAGGGPNNCWDSLFQLQACTGEVISFFLNGKTYLGPGCCRAIRVVGHDCWPEMLSSLGFTVQEADVLLGYCDVDEQQIIHSPPTASPPVNNTTP